MQTVYGLSFFLLWFSLSFEAYWCWTGLEALRNDGSKGPKNRIVGVRESARFSKTFLKFGVWDEYGKAHYINYIHTPIYTGITSSCKNLATGLGECVA
jgi:hypothetical protein